MFGNNIFQIALCFRKWGKLLKGVWSLGVNLQTRRVILKTPFKFSKILTTRDGAWLLLNKIHVFAENETTQ